MWKISQNSHEKGIRAAAVNPACGETAKGGPVGLSTGDGTTPRSQGFINSEILWGQFLKDLRKDENKECRKQVVVWRLRLLSETLSATSLHGLRLLGPISFTFSWQNTPCWKWEHGGGEEGARPFGGRLLWTSCFSGELLFWKTMFWWSDCMAQPWQGVRHTLFKILRTDTDLPLVERN